MSVAQVVKILDFAHAAERVNQVGQAVLGEGSEPAKNWLGERLHQLKHAGPSALLSELAELKNQKPNSYKPKPKRESRTRCGLPEARETG